MRILVIGGTGTVGSTVVETLVSRDASVRVMTRSPDSRPAVDGVEYVEGDLAEPDSLAPAFQDMDKLFLLTPIHPEESELGRAAVEAAQAADISHLVFQSIHRVEEAPHLPHFRSKMEIGEAIRDSGIPWTFISPNNFYQNDLQFRDAIVEHGVYPQPLGGVGLARVDVRDIADAVANALFQPGHQGRNYPLVGPDPLTGEETAAIWSRHLGHRVRYAGDDLDAWEEGVKDALPEWLREDFRMMFEFFQVRGLLASVEDLELAHRILRHEPRTFDAFASETAAAWKEERDRTE